MCDMGHDHGREGFGFLVDTPEIRALIDAARGVKDAIRLDEERVTALRPAFARLLAAEGWLPDACARPDANSGMGGGIAQYALYRAEDASLCLFLAGRTGRRQHAGARSPGVGTRGHLSRPPGRNRLPASR